MRTIILCFCLSLFVVSADELHPTITYPKGHHLEGQVIDTALVGAPVKLSKEQSKKYFSDFDPLREIVLSNVGSGIEYEWFIVRIPLNNMKKPDISEVGFLHEEFSKGMLHGSVLFKTNRQFEFIPQNQKSKLLKPFKSPYIVASFEGLRKRGMSFGIKNVLAGNLIASWNFYTFKGTIALAVEAKGLEENEGKKIKDIEFKNLAKTLYYQKSTLHRIHAERMFDTYLNKALNDSYKIQYNPLTLTCNNAIEDVLQDSLMIKDQSSWLSIVKDLYHKRYVNNFHLHLVKERLAYKERVLLNKFPDFHEFFYSAIQDHQQGTKYGR